jgi:hypothetical protein
MPALAERAWPWLALALLAGWRVAADWPLADNHAYLLAYWCLAVALAAGTAEREGTLAASARLLVGCVFALASLQKGILSPDYLDGTFFQHLLWVDDRFEGLVRLLGADDATLAANRAYLEADPHAAPLDPSARLVALPAVAQAATALTWATLASECAVALAFVCPTRFAAARARDPVLIAFSLGTYALAPVASFGWLLLAMGVAACEPGRRRVRGLYLATFAALVFFDQLPWLDVLAESLRGR